MNHWDARAEALLARMRTGNEVPADARSRVRSAVARSIALSAAAGASVSVVAAPTAMAKLPVAVKTASSLLPTAGTGGAAAALAPLAAGLALGLSAITPSEVTVPPLHAELVAAASAVAPPRATPVAMTRSPTPHEMAGSKRIEAPMRLPLAVASAKSVVASSGLAEEASVLEHARLVLRQGDPRLSLRLLDQHRREFPHGALAFEASATRAEALCKLGRGAEGSSTLEQLEAAAPGSGVVARVRASCRAAAAALENAEEE
jgi:hypothetical protein